MLLRAGAHACLFLDDMFLEVYTLFLGAMDGVLLLLIGQDLMCSVCMYSLYWWLVDNLLKSFAFLGDHGGSMYIFVFLVS